jgi:hypothetical protein
MYYGMSGKIDLQTRLVPMQICRWIISIDDLVNPDNRDSKATIQLRIEDGLASMGDLFVYLYKQSTSSYVPRYEKIQYTSLNMEVQEVSLDVS